MPKVPRGPIITLDIYSVEKADTAKALEAYSEVESILLEHPELLSSRIILLVHY